MKPEIEKYKNMGLELALLHRQPLPGDMRGWTLLDGLHLLEAGRKAGMALFEDIQTALKKTDGIVKQIAAAVPNPYVALRGGTGHSGLLYGNPSWDLGLAVNTLGRGGAEPFLKGYLRGRGVQVTIIELFAGILYAKLNMAIATRDEAEWQRLAQNECSRIASGGSLSFDELSAGAIARLGLPGLRRVG